MRFSGAIAAAGLAAGVAAAGNETAPVYVTSVVTAFTTYCPEATMLTHGGSTYTVSSATTLTITHCPGGCTITAPVYSSTGVPTAPAPYTSVMTSASVPAPYPTESTTAPVVVPTPSGAPYPSGNGTVPGGYPSGTAAPSGSATGTTPPSYNGAATYGSAFGAGLLAVAGAVAFL